MSFRNPCHMPFLKVIPCFTFPAVKTRKFNCCVFEMKHATGMETCRKIYFFYLQPSVNKNS